jgi:hypothetical protein
MAATKIFTSPYLSLPKSLRRKHLGSQLSVAIPATSKHAEFSRSSPYPLSAWKMRQLRAKFAPDVHDNYKSDKHQTAGKNGGRATVSKKEKIKVEVRSIAAWQIRQLHLHLETRSVVSVKAKDSLGTLVGISTSTPSDIFR